MKIGKYKLEHILDPRRWLMFLKHLAYTWGEPMGEDKQSEQDMLAYCEQVVVRSLFCPICLKNGSCTVCGCKTPALFLEREASCSDFKWGEVMNYEDWEKYKNIYGLKLALEQ